MWADLNPHPSTVNGPWRQHIVELQSKTLIFEFGTLKKGGQGSNLPNGPRYHHRPLAQSGLAAICNCLTPPPPQQNTHIYIYEVHTRVVHTRVVHTRVLYMKSQNTRL